MVAGHVRYRGGGGAERADLQFSEHKLAAACPVIDPAVGNQVRERADAGGERLAERGPAPGLEETGGVGAVGQRDGGQAAGDWCQAPVGADGGGSSGGVAVERDQDAAVG